MGSCLSERPAMSIHTRHKSQISKELERDARTDRYKKKILILGPKRSGKSTIFNQLKFIHGGGFIDSERQQAKLDIISYIIHSLQTIIACVEEYEKYKQFSIHRFTLNNETKQSVEYIKNLDINNAIDQTIAYHIEILSKQTAIQKIISDADRYYIDISIRYFLKHFNRIKDINYIPSDQDIIQLRIKTDAFNEQNIEILRNQFAVYDIDYKPDICDVNKYMHYFEHVTAIIFVASLCAFDEQIFEDNKSYQEQLEWKQSMELMETYCGKDILNIVLEFIGHPKSVMQQSFDLFESVCDNEWFKDTAIILFLSKSDLFAQRIWEYQKIQNDINIPFLQCFPDYMNGIKYDVCSQYVNDKFMELNGNENRDIYTHIVNSTDITLMTKIFNDVQHVIISASLKQAGLMS